MTLERPATASDLQSYLVLHAADNASDLIAVTDPDGNLVFANQAFVKALGYSQREILGKHFRVLLSGNNSSSFFQEVSTRMHDPAGWKSECLAVRRDGSDLPVSFSVGPILDHEGHEIGNFGIAQEIVARKLAEEELRKSEEQFRQLADNIREVFFIYNAEPPGVVYISPAYEEVWRRTRRSLYERAESWIESVHPDDRETATELFARSLQGIQAQARYRVVRPDGSIRWIDARSFPVADKHGKFQRVVGIAEDVTLRKQEEEALRETDAKLNAALARAEQQAHESAKLTDLLDILQSCQTLEEAYKIIEASLPQTLPSRSGALCVTSPSRNMVEAAATWGNSLATEKTFLPEQCWALRRGKVHRVDDSHSALRCAHVTSPPAAGYLCVPLAAQGETLGVLYVESLPFPASSTPARGPDPMEALSRQAVGVGERISLALANLKLREVLRAQSIRDPLTGLFNRRYMEESLERELRRAIRNNQSVAMLMLDIDHFKRFNDTYGHQAGDTLLRALGDFLLQRTRGQDVACRYGGEEFALILSGATTEAARSRAEVLRTDLKNLTVQHAGQVLGRVTFSIGISGFPGLATAEELVRAADLSLYRAKSEGRDRVVVWDSSTTRAT